MVAGHLKEQFVQGVQHVQEPATAIIGSEEMEKDVIDIEKLETEHGEESGELFKQEKEEENADS